MLFVSERFQFLPRIFDSLFQCVFAFDDVHSLLEAYDEGGDEVSLRCCFPLSDS